MSINKKRIRTLIAILTVFLLLTLFYKWQLATSKYYLNHGDSSYNVEDYSQALKDYKYATTIDGNRNIAYAAKMKRAEIFYASGMFNEAKKELLEAIRENRIGYEAYELLGDINYTERKFNLAADYYDQALEFNSGDINKSIKIKKGVNFIAQNKMDLAENIFSELHLKNNGANDGEVLYYLALFDFDKNISSSDFLEEAGNSNSEILKNRIREIENFVSGYSENKNSDFNNVKIADLYNKINESYLAINRINVVLENNQNYRDAWIVSGEANFIIGDYEKSLEDFKKALVLDSHNPEICFWLGSVYEKIGDVQKSKEFFEKYELLR